MKKKLVLLAVAFVAVPTVSFAAPIIPCAGTTFSVTTSGASIPGTFTCDGLTFSDFLVANVSGGGNIGRVDVNGIVIDNGVVVLNANPNLGAGEHVNFFYTVSGGVNQIDLSVGGSVATILERACTNPIALAGQTANLCSNPAQDQVVAALGTITVHSGDLPQPVLSSLFTGTSPIYVYKDISTGTNGSLSAFNQSFHTPVPEPASLTLLGTGLLGFVRASRRRRSMQRA